MTVKRQWMLALMLSAALSVLINSIVFSALINRYFIDNSTVNYKKHVSQVVAFSTDALITGDYSRAQLEMQLESHLSDPINRIRLYNADGKLLADVGSASGKMADMMRSGMMSRFLRNPSEEIDSIDITKNGSVIGKLNITRYSSIGNSLETRKFTRSLVINSLLSCGIAFLLTLLIGDYFSKRMSRDLTLTAQQATDIDLGQRSDAKKSSIVEIGTIQQSLETLQSRLMMKQTSRKQLIDELVHQTRTPLTILRTHLEGFRDGVIRFTPEEIRTCESQIENLSSIITNMSGLIDAGKEIDPVLLTSVEISGLIRQIAAGLKAQFDRKQISLQVAAQHKITVQTDSYRLSQSIYNLLTNAFKFTGSGGTVTLSYQAEGNELAISIQDTGAGIPPEEQEKIFDAYYRGKNSPDTGGDGIGLYIVKENLKKIGGRIDLESKVGAGSKFTIRIPLRSGLVH